MSTPCLIENDAQRACHIGIPSACQQKLRATNDYRERVVELVAGPSRELAERIQFSLGELDFLGFDPIAHRRDYGLDSALQQAAISDHGRPRFPSAAGNPAVEPLSQVGWSVVAP